MGGAAVVRRPAPCGPYCGTLTGFNHHGCRCLAGYDAMNEWHNGKRRAVREGTWQPYVDAGPARRHLRKLRKLGMSYQSIAAVTFLAWTHLRCIDRGDYAKLRPATAELILTTGFTVVGACEGSEVPSVGAQRRLQALRLAGWPFKTLDALSGVSGFQSNRVMRQTGITWGRHLLIRDLCDRLSGCDPVASGVSMGQWKRAVSYGMVQGWVPLSAWVQDIDDPRSEPYKAVVHRRVQQAPAGARRLEIVEETAHLASYGFPPERIAEVLGIEWASVLVAHQRAGVPVPGRLVA